MRATRKFRSIFSKEVMPCDTVVSKRGVDANYRKDAIFHVLSTVGSQSLIRQYSVPVRYG
jgi:hypothetical protein